MKPFCRGVSFFILFLLSVGNAKEKGRVFDLEGVWHLATEISQEKFNSSKMENPLHIQEAFSDGNQLFLGIWKTIPGFVSHRENWTLKIEKSKRNKNRCSAFQTRFEYPKTLQEMWENLWDRRYLYHSYFEISFDCKTQEEFQVQGNIFCGGIGLIATFRFSPIPFYEITLNFEK